MIKYGTEALAMIEKHFSTAFEDLYENYETNKDNPD